MTDHLEAVKIHITGSDVPLTNHEPRRRRRGVSLRSFTLTANDPVQQILPLNTNRCEAWAQAFVNNITIYGSKADALAGGNGGVPIPAANLTPYPLNTTDAVWATAAVLPTVVSVTAIIEGD